MSIPPISTLSKERRTTRNKIKDDLKTVEEVWDTNFLHMDIPISKKRHNSGNLTKQMSCTFNLHKYSV